MATVIREHDHASADPYTSKAVELMTNVKTIGLFGGTFDPVHNGHLRMALELKQHLRLDEMRLIPAHTPPHRETPVASARQRAAMVEIALSDYPELEMDLLELENPEPSYSVNTLRQLRQQLGDEVSLCLAMGMDSLISLPSWHQWQELLKLAHVIVAARPGWQLPQAGKKEGDKKELDKKEVGKDSGKELSEIADYIEQHRGDASQLSRSSRGSIVIKELSLLPISSTAIREQLARGESAQTELPSAVFQYIQQHRLYRPNFSTTVN